MTKKSEGPFTIEINEYQRALLVRVLSNIDTEFVQVLKCCAADPSGIEDSAFNETEMLKRMLEDLPSDSQENMISSFCS